MGRSSSSPTSRERNGKTRRSVSAPKPSTDLVWLSAISRYLLDSGLQIGNFGRVGQWAGRVRRALSRSRWKRRPYSPDYLSLSAHHRSRMNLGSEARVHPLGDGCHAALPSSDTSTAISKLLLVTGNLHAARNRRISTAVGTTTFKVRRTTLYGQ